MRYVSVLIGLGVAATACVNAAEVEDDLDPAVGESVPLEREEIARVRVGEAEIVYFALSDGSVAVRDSTVRGALSTGDRSPLEDYLEITAPSAAVPRALLAIESSAEIKERAATRRVVDRVLAPTLAVIADVEPPLALNGYCVGGSSQSWASEVCPATNWDVDFCHNGTWYSVSDEVGSSNKKHSSRSVTLGCGANGHVKHHYWFWGVRYTPIDETTPSGTVVTWSHYGGWSLERQVVHSRTTDDSFVRAASHFNH